MADRILIDAGPSPRGFHRIEAVLRCPRLYALGYGRGRSEDSTRFPPTYPLVRGGIGHVGLAHLYARLRAHQTSGDPDAYYTPREAMELCAERFGMLGVETLPAVQALIESYVQRYVSDQRALKIVGVEELLETEFRSYRYTARADLIWEDRAGKVWITDHKIVNRIESKSIRRYCLSGQFLGLTHLGFERYGDSFGGVTLNLLGARDHSFHRQVIDPAPDALERFPETVKRAERLIEEIEERGDRVSGVYSEFACMTPYGECPAFELCRFGVTR